MLLQQWFSGPYRLLFIIVVEALSRDMREGCPEELPYADNLVLRLLMTWGLPLEFKERLSCACVCSAMLSRNEAWLVKKDDMVRLERTDARMGRWICKDQCIEFLL